MRALLLVNPEATATPATGRDGPACALASELKLDVVRTEYRGHATLVAQQARDEGYDVVVVHGGDGTVNEVVNGLLARGPGGAVPMLGVVPGGSANVFARALGLRRDPVHATRRLLTALESGRSRQIGLGRAGERWFTFNAGLGWDADAVARVERQRAQGRVAGPALYVRAAVAAHVRMLRRAPELGVELPDGHVVEGLRSLIVSNTDPWTYLGPRPVRMNPGSSFDTGLGVFALRRVGTPTVLRHIGQALRRNSRPRGRNLMRIDDVVRIRVHSVEPVALQVDGDLVGHRTQIDFTAVPRALRVAV